MQRMGFPVGIDKLIFTWFPWVRADAAARCSVSRCTGRDWNAEPEHSVRFDVRFDVFFKWFVDSVHKTFGIL